MHLYGFRHGLETWFLILRRVRISTTEEGQFPFDAIYSTETTATTSTTSADRLTNVQFQRTTHRSSQITSPKNESEYVSCEDSNKRNRMSFCTKL